jgi:hypothetical protein
MVKDPMAYRDYRWFITSSGKLVIGGKSAIQNEEIMSKIRNDDVVMHTSSPGSPFCIIKKPTKQDLEEVAIFTASFSQQWKSGKKMADVDVFLGSQVSKTKDMKVGTFGVFGKSAKKKVELKLVLDIQNEKLRAVPSTAANNPLLTLLPGNLTKEQATETILKILEKKGINVKKEEIMAAIPSDKIAIQER